MKNQARQNLYKQYIFHQNLVLFFRLEERLQKHMHVIRFENFFISTKLTLSFSKRDFLVVFQNEQFSQKVFQKKHRLVGRRIQKVSTPLIFCNENLSLKNDRNIQFQIAIHKFQQTKLYLIHSELFGIVADHETLRLFSRNKKMVSHAELLPCNFMVQRKMDKIRIMLSAVLHIHSPKRQHMESNYFIESTQTMKCIHFHQTVTVTLRSVIKSFCGILFGFIKHI